MKNGLNEAVARYICYAQMSSEAGKSYNRSFSSSSKRTRNYIEYIYSKGYYFKEYYILKAIELIARSKNSGFHYSVVDGYDQNGYQSYIVYFNFKIDNTRHQISFHVFCNDFHKYVKKSSKTYWDEKSSYYASHELWRYMGF